MSSRRIAKVAEALRESISTTVLFELKDPRVRNVTVLRTEVSPDLRSARVYVSVMGDEKTQALSMHGLRAARGFIQSKIADRLDLRYTPVLTFVLDHGVKLSTQTSAIIREALASPASQAADPESAGEEAVLPDAAGGGPGDDDEGQAAAGARPDDDERSV
ncbi:MAG: 30S ribosome-binding factor RbfA [Deltaproteobacteria bacterium]